MVEVVQLISLACIPWTLWSFKRIFTSVAHQTFCTADRNKQHLWPICETRMLWIQYKNKRRARSKLQMKLNCILWCLSRHTNTISCNNHCGNMHQSSKHDTYPRQVTFHWACHPEYEKLCNQKFIIPSFHRCRGGRHQYIWHLMYV